MNGLCVNNTNKISARVTILFVFCCAIIFISTVISRASDYPEPENLQSLSPNDQYTDFIDGIVESISDTNITVQNVEYTFGMEMKCIGVNGHPLEIGTVRTGDSVYIIFDPQTNEVFRLTLESRATDLPKNVSTPISAKKEKNRVMTYEDGVYKY